MSHLRSPGICFALFAGIFMLLGVTCAAASDLASNNFVIRGSIIDESGSTATSSNFTQVSAFNQVAVGESTSSNFILESGALYFSTTTLQLAQQNWRWYSDVLHETPTAPLANENTTPTSVDSLDIVKLRIAVKENGGVDITNLKFRLQFSTSASFAYGATYDVSATSTCTNASVWCYAPGFGFDNLLISTKTLSDADACASSAGVGCGTHNEEPLSNSSFTQSAHAAAEYEFMIKNVSAAHDTVYYFRLFNVTTGEALPLAATALYPSLRTAGTSLVFNISGMSSGIFTAGTTTSVTTTSTAVPFGDLSGSVDHAIGAQQLSVTTNANAGYTVYASALQRLVDDSTQASIDPVPTTNDAPGPFTIAPGASGSFGYHTSATLLGTGNPARFASPDTYAQLETTEREVAHYGTATTSDITNIVYKVQISALQPAGSYQATISYVVVPSF